MVWLMETKIDAVASYSLQRYLGFDNVFVLRASNKKGGFILFWKIYISLNLMHTRKSFIVSEIYHPVLAKWKKIVLCCIYMIQNIHNPWVLLGDLNDITSQAYKNGGLPFNCAVK